MLLYAESAVYIIPGSHVIARYAKSSHQNDPGRTVLLALFAIRTLLQCRTRADNGEKHLVQFSERLEVDELVDEWTPEPHSLQKSNPISRPYPWSLVQMDRPKLANRFLILSATSSRASLSMCAIETLRKYGVDVHMDLERDIADFIGTEASILYPQGSSTMPCVISAFAKRDDISVTDQGVDFSIEGLANFAFYDVLLSVEKERRKRRGPLTRRFIITEGIFEKDGAMVDLPKTRNLKFCYRLILDESISFDTVGRTGRGLTELYNVPATQLDMIVGSVANGLGSSEEFLRGLAYRRGSPENVRTMRAVLDRVEAAASVSAKLSNPAPREAPSFGFVCEEHLLQDIVDDAGTQAARAGAV
ncbi:serine palmitoyltransferase [Lactarius pseudohatsudake]|nr:serine palmitoyltransferase [Lactarius pseudohatsudake]